MAFRELRTVPLAFHRYRICSVIFHYICIEMEPSDFNAQLPPLDSKKTQSIPPSPRPGGARGVSIARVEDTPQTKEMKDRLMIYNQQYETTAEEQRQRELERLARERQEAMAIDETDKNVLETRKQLNMLRLKQEQGRNEIESLQEQFSAIKNDITKFFSSSPKQSTGAPRDRDMMSMQSVSTSAMKPSYRDASEVSALTADNTVRSTQPPPPPPSNVVDPVQMMIKENEYKSQIQLLEMRLRQEETKYNEKATRYDVRIIHR